MLHARGPCMQGHVENPTAAPAIPCRVWWAFLPSWHLLFHPRMMSLDLGGPDYGRKDRDHVARILTTLSHVISQYANTWL